MSATSLRVAPSGECLWGKSLVWLVDWSSGVFASCPLVHAMDGHIELHDHWIGSCQSTATSETVKMHCSGLPCKLSYIRIQPLPFLPLQKSATTTTIVHC